MTHLLDLKKTNFVLWRPGSPQTPALVIGKLQLGNPSTLANQHIVDLVQHPDFPEPWMLACRQPCGRAAEGETYLYFLGPR
jgi:hypothetical protein